MLIVTTEVTQFVSTGTAIIISTEVDDEVVYQLDFSEEHNSMYVGQVV